MVLSCQTSSDRFFDDSQQFVRVKGFFDECNGILHRVLARKSADHDHGYLLQPLILLLLSLGARGSPLPVPAAVTLPAHHRPLAGFFMTALAVLMKGLSERRRFSGTFKAVTVRAAPVLRGRIRQFLPVLEHMVAGIAGVYLGFFIMQIMPEHGPGPLGI